MYKELGSDVPDLTPRRRLSVLAICCMSLLIVGMDNTIVNVALPSIRRELGASVSGLQWTVDAYTVVLASLLILSGSTADRLGRRRTFQTGLVLFTLGSLLCSVAPGLGWLVAFRMMQAVGGSMLNPVAMSIITNVFTDPRERARAIGVWGGVIGLSIGIGPVVGGLLTETLSWRAVFWINVPIGVAAVILTALFVPESKAARTRRLDPVGQILVIVLLLSLTYAIIEAPRAGWGSLEIDSLVAVAVLSLLALILYEPKRADPLIEIRFFRSIPFSGATLIAVCTFGAFSGFLFLNTLYLQDVRGLSALRAGLCMLPIAVVIVLLGPLSGRVVAARGPRSALIVAGVCMALGALGLTRLTSDTSFGWLFGAYIVFAIGFAVVNVPITNTAVSGMPRSQAGVAAAVASTSRQVGASLGVAVVGSVVSTAVSAPTAANFAPATHVAWWILVGLGLTVLALGIGANGQRARTSAAQIALLFDDDALDERTSIGSRS